MDKEDILATITRSEFDELLSIKRGIEGLKQTLAIIGPSISELETRRSDWWEYVNGKYNLPRGNKTIDGDTFEITFVKEEEVKER